MTCQQTLTEAVRQSAVLAARFFKGFDDSNHTAQPAPLANHFAWCLGHVALVLSGCARHLDGQDLPPEDFGDRADAAAGAGRYDPAILGFGSTPVADPSAYPSCRRCIEIFNHTIDRLATAVGAADDATLAKVVPWGGSHVPLWTIVTRNTFHVGIHTGQIVDLRRALGMPPALG